MEEEYLLWQHLVKKICNEKNESYVTYIFDV